MKWFDRIGFMIVVLCAGMLVAFVSACSGDYGVNADICYGANGDRSECGGGGASFGGRSYYTK